MMTKRFIFRLISVPVLMLTLALSTSAWAIDLQSAKAQGLVGEQPNGYLGLVKPKAAASVSKMMKDINAKRKKVYQGIAQKNGTKLNVVEAMAGKKAMGKTPKGQYVRSSSGAWTKK